MQDRALCLVRSRRGAPALLAGACVWAALAAVAASAADDPISLRRQIMRKNERVEQTANNPILGKFRPEKAINTMKALQDNMTDFPALFPEGSDTGDTKASPSIWTNMDDFKSLCADLVVDAKAAETAASQGQDAFTAAWQAVAEGCRSCREKYTSGGVIQ